MLLVFFHNLGEETMSIPVAYAYQVFIAVVLVFWLVLYIMVPRFRHAQLKMSLCGGVGGLLVGAWHRLDFWIPPSFLGYTSDRPLVAVEDIAFGFGFTGLMVVLLPLIAGWSFVEQPSSMRVQGWKKIDTPLVATAIGGVLYFSDMNSVLACSVSFLYCAVWTGRQRPDLRFMAYWGAVVTFAAFTLLVGSFLLVASNRVELAESICQFSIRNGAWMTAWVLALWSLSFGAWMTSLYPFVADKCLSHSAG